MKRQNILRIIIIFFVKEINMKIKNQNKIKEKIIGKLLSIIYHLDNSGNSLFADNGEENFINQFIDSTRSIAPVIFDVGANVGTYSKLLSDKLNEAEYSLHIFEPQKSCFMDLQLKFKDNKQTILNNFGLSKTEESAVVYKTENKGGLTSLYKRNLDFYNLQMNMEETIELRRANKYIQSKNIKHINLLKIDVEGYELNVLTGFGEYLNADFIDFIQFEYGGADLDSHVSLLDFYSLLLPLGFKIAKIMPKYLEIRDYNPRLDNFVYSNYIAISPKFIKNI